MALLTEAVFRGLAPEYQDACVFESTGDIIETAASREMNLEFFLLR